MNTNKKSSFKITSKAPFGQNPILAWNNQPAISVINKSSKPFPFAVWAVSNSDENKWGFCGNRMTMEQAQNLVNTIKKKSKDSSFHIVETTIEQL